MIITEQFLRSVCNKNSNTEIILKLIDSLNEWFPIYEMDRKIRACYFLAQCAHETGGFLWFKELGGKEYCSKYEPETAIGKSLGNIKVGDGYKYKGRGMLQISGRYNYDFYGKLTNKNLIDFPDLLLDIDTSTHVACEFWKKHRLNQYSDSNDFIGVTKRINGGFNGLKNRENFLSILLKSWDREIF
jgi:Predicted chitinase